MSEKDEQAQIRQSVEHIAERAASKAVRETLILFGIDANDPIKAQKQFAALGSLASERTLANLEFLDRFHTATDRVADTGWQTFIRVIVTAGLGLIAIVTKDYWLSHIWKG